MHRSDLTGRFLFPAWLVGILVISTGCFPTKQARLAAVGWTVQDVATAAARQSDTALIREGTPAFVMLVDGLIEASPQNRDLLLAGCQAYASYASTLAGEGSAPRQGRLYRKARDYGFLALSGRGDFGQAASGSLDDFTAFLKRYGKKDVPALFWTSTAWAGWIAAQSGSVEAMADLPALEATMKRTLELDESFYYGGPHLLMGVYLAAKPAVAGGNLPKSREHFERAFALGAHKTLAARVYFAEYYARGMKDRELYTRTLQEVLDAPADTVPELTLSNTIAQEKARQLLKKTEDYFDLPN